MRKSQKVELKDNNLRKKNLQLISQTYKTESSSKSTRQRSTNPIEKWVKSIESRQRKYNWFLSV